MDPEGPQTCGSGSPTLSDSLTISDTKKGKLQRKKVDHLVSGENDGNVLADPDEIPVPVGHILVGHARRHVEHDDGTLTLDTGNKIVIIILNNPRNMLCLIRKRVESKNPRKRIRGENPPIISSNICASLVLRAVE